MQYPTRKSMQLHSHDYSGAQVYFVTICVQDRKNMFWEVGEHCVLPQVAPIPLSHLEKIVDREIQKMSTIYDSVKIEKYCIMPDHIHLLIAITTGAGAKTGKLPYRIP